MRVYCLANTPALIRREGLIFSLGNGHKVVTSRRVGGWRRLPFNLASLGR